MDISVIIAIIFIFTRITSFIIVTPIFFPQSTPKQLKAMFSMMLAFFFAMNLELPVITEVPNDIELIIAIFNEACSGILLGLVVGLWFYFIKMGGSFLDLQMGLSMLSMFDPNTKTNATMLANISHWVAILVFFIVDGHHMIIRMLSKSIEVIALGKNIIMQDSMGIMIEAFASYFVLGLRISIPLVLLIIISDIVMGLISRSVPQLNVMVVGMPIKIVVGVASFLISLPMIVKVILSGFDIIPEIINQIFALMPIVFIFSEEKTEEATPKKKSDSKKKGQVPRSKEITTALSLGAILLIIMTLGSYVVNNLKSVMIHYFSTDFKITLTEFEINNLIISSFIKFTEVFLPIVVPIMIVGIATSIMQTGFIASGEGLKPSLSKINPIKGLKNMFSVKKLVDLAKNLLVVGLLSYVGIGFMRDNYENIMKLGGLYFPTFGLEFKLLLMEIIFKIFLVLVAIAAADYFMQFKMHEKDMKMTKQEIKEESKQAEGDPHVKGMRKQKQREMAMGRMMQSVPDATVVITNPTHLAIAIKYDKDSPGSAPMVIAKGADHMALKIKEKAKEHNVPIVEDRALARMMYETVEVDSEIPMEMYKAIAEILAVIYKIK
ncbi:fused FliR family export protein/FlhB family type III secretion system protein [uncultured Clostridium sp.]|uniref:fused FliR family export protein/FlhB family type III secretion system protein n=1 Tax=uncultured Clostridium sp. TaxID=59620 RepID=UPI00263103A2|nr:fused FliR family export protein/FlhB family type III secretion system protein [uncultured Clostridium sp.]